MNIPNVTKIVLIALAVSMFQGCASAAKQTKFASPDDAVQSLVSAVRVHDKAQVKQILGPDSDKVVSSGDAVADRDSAEKFVAAYDAKHQLVNNADGSVTLSLGEKDWPLPIPVVKDAKGGQWTFDTAAGKEEILNRRIGQNELNVIKVCQAIGDAEREYAQRDPNGQGIPVYARKFISDAGKKNGLYWKTEEGEAPSPLGQLASEAADEGYVAGKHQAYHGYHYKILTAQGAHAPGGKVDYIVKGKLIGGFAIVAWPAEYGNSGIMTFIVNHDGIVYQKDLGAGTGLLVKTISAYDPGPGWNKAE
jgi:hypothetical protein